MYFRHKSSTFVVVSGVYVSFYVGERVESGSLLWYICLCTWFTLRDDENVIFPTRTRGAEEKKKEGKDEELPPALPRHIAISPFPPWNVFMLELCIYIYVGFFLFCCLGFHLNVFEWRKKFALKLFFVLGFYRFFLAMRYARPFRFPWKIIMDFFAWDFLSYYMTTLGGFFLPSTSLCLPGGILFAFLLNWRLRRLFSPTSPLLKPLVCFGRFLLKIFCWTSLTRSRSIFVFKGRKLPNESWRGLKGNSFKRLQERFLKSRNGISIPMLIQF